MKVVMIALLLQVFTCQSEGGDLKSYADICSIKDPQLNECMKAAAQKLIPILSKGIPELNVPPLDPMFSPKVVLSESTPHIDMEITYTNVTQTGLSHSKIDNVIMDVPNTVMIFNISYPTFTFEGHYVSKGHVFQFQMSGDGKANITVQHSKGDLVIRYHIEDNHIKEDDVQMIYTFDEIFLDYTHVLFDGDEELGKSAAAFINENAKEIMNGFKPSLERFYGGLIRENLRGFFEKVPYNLLFKDT